MDNLEECFDLPGNLYEGNKNTNAICSNCCSPFDPNDSPKIDNVTNSQVNIEEMLSSIYKLSYHYNYLKSAPPPPATTSSQHDDKINEAHPPLILCPSCDHLLLNLYSLFCQFNQIRQLNSQLAREIQAVDEILNNYYYKNNVNHLQSNEIKNLNNIKVKHSPFSPDGGPWIRLGLRLEQMEFEEIGYKPQDSFFHQLASNSPVAEKRQRFKSKCQASSLNVDFNEEDQPDLHDNNSDNEEDPEWHPPLDEDGNASVIDDEPTDVKPFSEPLSAELDEVPVQPFKETCAVKLKTKRAGFTAAKAKVKRAKQSSASSTLNLKSKSKKRLKKEKSPDDDEEPKPKRKRKRHRKGANNDDDDDEQRGKGRPASKLNKFTPEELELFNKSRGEGLDPLAAVETEQHKCVAAGCTTTVKSLQALLTHEKKCHKNSGPFVCPLGKGYKRKGPPCGFIAKTVDLLRIHLGTLQHRRDDRDKVRCLVCNAILRNEAGYRTHFYKSHTKLGQQVAARDAKKLADKIKAKTQEKHAKGFVCDICQVDFMTKMKYTSHRQAVHGDFGPRYKPLVCEICGKMCGGLNRLKKHISLVHSDEKPFICAFCGRQYKAERHLNTHIERSHDLEGRLRYNAYCKENNRRRKIIAEALARRQAQEKQQQQQSEPHQETRGDVDQLDVNVNYETSEIIPPPIETLSTCDFTNSSDVVL